MAFLKKATISKKGQTTVPSEVRQFLKIKSGDSVLFEIVKNEVHLKKAPSVQEDIAYLKMIEKTLAPEWMGDEDDDL